MTPKHEVGSRPERFVILLTEMDINGRILGFKGYGKGYVDNDYEIHGGRFSRTRESSREDGIARGDGYKSKSYAVRMAEKWIRQLLQTGEFKGVYADSPFLIEVIDKAEGTTVWKFDYTPEYAGIVRKNAREARKLKNLVRKPSVVTAVALLALGTGCYVLTVSTEINPGLIWVSYLGLLGVVYALANA